jgi:hypothetical protein
VAREGLTAGALGVNSSAPDESFRCRASRVIFQNFAIGE